MRIAVATALFAAGCEKQLNPAYCADPDHFTDPSCDMTSSTAPDASAPCQASTQCKDPALPVCDTTSGQCVACSGTTLTGCPADDKVCINDTCAECLTTSQCEANQICNPSTNQCVAAEPGTVFYVSVSGSGDCSTPTTPCELPSALGKLGSNAIIDIVDNGTYSGASIALGSGALVIFVNAGSATLSNVPISVSNSASLTLDSVAITNASSDGIDCTNATLATGQIYVTSSGSNGINASGCTLTIERSRIGSNKQSGIAADNSTVTIVNDFVYDNNTGASNKYAGVLLSGSTKGTVRFNSIAYNGYNNGSATATNVGGGLSCMAGAIDATDNLVIGNNTQFGQTYLDVQYNSSCSSSTAAATRRT